jgi:4'-phosphopantetheinyl transferase
MTTTDPADWIMLTTHPSLGKEEIHLWKVELNPIEAISAQLRAFLSKEEQDRADAFYFEYLCRRYIAAHAALRILISRYLHTDLSSIQILTSKNGKPYLDPVAYPDRLSFNLTHSADLAVIAFARELEIGIDVETIRPIDDLQSLARVSFSPGENATLNSLPPDQKLAAFFNCWTRKEALLKATGEGLALPLDEFEVSLAVGEPARLLRCSLDIPLQGPWSLVSLQPTLDTIATLAVPTERFRVAYYVYDFLLS